MLTLRPLAQASQADRSNVLRVFLEAPSYTQLVEGRAPSEADVDDFFEGKPDSKEAQDKSVFGFYAGDDMIGCADVIRSFPDDECAWIGLLLLSERHQNHGHGRTALALITATVREWGYTKLQLAAVATNPRALTFWRREGFIDRYRRTSTRFTGDLVVMERQVGPLLDA